MLPITDHAQLDADRLATLADEIRPLRSLETLIGWASARQERVADIIEQDEFSLDVLVSYGDLWLSFACT